MTTEESDQNFNTGFELTAQPGCEFDNGERPSKRQIDGSQEDLVALKKDFCPAGQHPFLEENPQIVPVPIPKNPEIVPQRKPEEEPEVYPNHATDWCDKIAVCCEGTIVREKYQFLRATGCTYCTYMLQMTKERGTNPCKSTATHSMMACS